MKNYLYLIFAISSIGSLQAMLFKKVEDNYLPVFRPKQAYWEDKCWDEEPLVSFFTEKSIKKPAIKYNRVNADGKVIEDEIKAEDVKDNNGDTVHIDMPEMNKEAIRRWCNEFKQKSKRPGMWIGNLQDKKYVENIQYCYFKNMNQAPDIDKFIEERVAKVNQQNLAEQFAEDFTDYVKEHIGTVDEQDLFRSLVFESGKQNKVEFKVIERDGKSTKVVEYDKTSRYIDTDTALLKCIKKLQENEWDVWQMDSQGIYGMRIVHNNNNNEIDQSNDPELKAARKLYQTLESIKKYYNAEKIIIFNHSPYYKKYKKDEDDDIVFTHDLENNAYHETLQSLQVTKEVMQHELNNISYLQRLWHMIWGGSSHQTQKAFETVQNEIKLFKDNDRVVSKKKDKDGNEIMLTARDVFTKSCLQRSIAQRVQAARE